MTGSYDAVLLLSFGGPEGPDDVMPFLENVVRGRGVPAARLAEVAEHYQHFGGVSPINEQNRELLAALGKEFAAHGIDLPLYWGNRNWHPLLADTLRQMRADGVRRALAFATSAYSSYSSCRQYRDDIATAQREVGPDAPEVEKLRHFYDHPGFVGPHVDAVKAALGSLDPARRGTTRIVFTAHSVPMSMDASSGPDGGLYSAQLTTVAGLVSAAAAPDLAWDLVWQSRSGPPQVPWLEPDVNDHLRAIAGEGVTDAVVSPIGFVSDHLEVIWDLDNEAKQTAGELGLGFARAATPGTDPRFVGMVRELVTERLYASSSQRRLAPWEASGPSCLPGCCPAPARRPAPAGH
ncbi:ferrochelatase [Cryptosporangium aurantiacum]|uniref:Coproporphyrin III ferrochelatase n=2 Tax=Cryptosporangium aurantiacum TaxID=134849 RepID=A0A1M7JC92_9ACTN|nr:ferrochelatase [Cryptosporangium aurantiacum]SHM50528.1 ferrochelatase [Cryptosporangium aurantiacum]